MAGFRLVHLRSAAELRAAAGPWDELWHRSDVAAPTARAEMIALWLDRFAPQSPFCGLAVERSGRFVAALPLVLRRRRPWRVAGLPRNVWGLYGDLLLDDTADLDAALQLLLDGIRGQEWRLLSLAPIAYESKRWQSFAAAWQSGAVRSYLTPMDQVGQVAMQTAWDAHQSRWSGNLRRQLRKARKRAELAGKLTLDVHRQLRANELERLLRLACQIEDFSWKGPAGTSILRSPSIFEWYLRQANTLADWGQLQLSFLRHDATAIAFEYGYRAKGTYFSAKVGYDPAYGHFSPGQVLRAMMFERLHAEGETSLVDFWGPLTEATAKWCTHAYRVGRVLLALDRTSSRVALAGAAALDRFRGSRFDHGD